MANLNDKFRELFGGDTDIVQGRAALHEVLPGSISAESKYSTNELNKKRRSVTGRESRVGNIRSAYGGDRERPSAPESPRQPAPTFEDQRYVSARQGEAGTSYGSGDASGPGFGNAPSPDGGGPLSDAVVGDLLGSAGMTTLGTGALMSGFGAGFTDLIGPSIGAGLSSLTGMGALNTIGGGIYSHYAGERAQKAYEDIQSPEYDTPQSVMDDWDAAMSMTPKQYEHYSSFDPNAAAEAGKVAAMSRFGLVGNLGRDLLSGLGDMTGMYDMDSTQDLAAREIYGQSIAPGPIDAESPFTLSGELNPNYGSPFGGIDLMAEQPSMLDKLGSALASPFSKPTAEDLKNFNFDTLTTSGQDIARAGDIMADGTRRGSLFGGQTDINEQAPPGQQPGALTDTQSNVTDTGQQVVDTPASPQDTQPEGLKSELNAAATAKAQHEQNVSQLNSAREAVQNAKGVSTHKEMGLQLSPEARKALSELNALESKLGLPQSKLSGPNIDPWTGTVGPNRISSKYDPQLAGMNAYLENFGKAGDQYGAYGWGTNYGAIQNDWEAINREISGRSGGNYDSFADKAVGDFLGGGGGGMSTYG